MKFFKSVLSHIYANVMNGRNFLYDKKWLNIYNSSVPVVSVGNITMGGTGKTPIIAELVRSALKQNLKPAIISRGYKGQIKTASEVTLENILPNKYGDEPTMLKMKFPDVPVFIAPRREAAVKLLLEKYKVDIIFADDAFQHRQLARQLDILVLDATEKNANYAVLPLGRARENLSALNRADFVVHNKINLVDTVTKKKQQDFFLSSLITKKTFIETKYKLNHLRNKKSLMNLEAIADKSVLLFSGIGQPMAFQKMLESLCKVKEHIVFVDHHKFTSEDIQRVVKKAQEWNVDFIVCTEKDFVKLWAQDNVPENIYYVELGIETDNTWNLLNERIVQLCR
jgi:tetraacyldisaccharide 4'-kinase